ncbi:hypothetical protein V5O48_008041, partial [Marasmius crinis-equi]
MDEDGHHISAMLKHLVLWFKKSFPEEYASTTAPLVRLVKQRIKDPGFPGRKHPYELREFEELREALGH